MDGFSLVATSLFSTENGWFSHVYTFLKESNVWNQTSVLEFEGLGKSLSPALTMDGLTMYTSSINANQSQGKVYILSLPVSKLDSHFQSSMSNCVLKY